jgi:glyoxylase-like metal-dependent hydrolase (beta-lactamase superfamily II)
MYNLHIMQSVKEIATGIYQVRIPLDGGHSFSLDYMNSYLVKGSAGWLMIDTGWYQPDSFKSLADSLHSLNLDFTDIHTIVLTHSHPDHYGMAGKIRQQAPRIELYCHRWEADLIESRYIKFSGPREDISFLLEKHGVPEAEINPLGSASMPVLQMVTITIPDHLLYGGEVISTGIFDLEVIWTPGHSPGHICLYEAQNRLLFCGDHVLPTITPNIGYHVLSGDNPLGDYFCSLGKLANLPVAAAYPGHEHEFTGLKGRISSIMEHHRQREAQIQNLISHQFSNSCEIARRLTWSLNLQWDEFPPLQKRAAITETIAHLEHMRWEGKVKKTVSNNRISYGPVEDATPAV